LNSIINLFVVLLFFSLAISKAGINIFFPITIVLVIFFTIKNKDYISIKKLPFPALYCLFIFLIGCMSAYFSNNEYTEFVLFIEKGSLLILPATLLLPLQDVRTRRAALISAAAGLIIAITFALYNWYKITGLQLTGVGINRITSFWDYGRWTEVLAYGLSIMIPLAFIGSNSRKKNIVLLSLIITSLICILIDGGRAGFISVLISSLLFLILNKTKQTILLAGLLFLGLFTLKDNPQIKPTIDRFTSIANTKNDYSNLGRLVMWKHGLGMMKEKFETDPKHFWLGTGPNHFTNNIQDYVKKHSSQEEVQKQTNNNFSFSDSHNTFLDLATKYGVIYSICFFICLISFLCFFINSIGLNNIWSYAGINLVINHFILGFFYTSGLGYQTIIFFCLLTLCISFIMDGRKNV
jgi:O-antigen ligase